MTLIIFTFILKPFQNYVKNSHRYDGVAPPAFYANVLNSNKYGLPRPQVKNYEKTNRSGVKFLSPVIYI